MPHDATTANRLNLLLESTGEGIFGIDMAGDCTFANQIGRASCRERV